MPSARVAVISASNKPLLGGVDESAFEGLDVLVDRVMAQSKCELLEAARGADVVMLSGHRADADLFDAMDGALGLCIYGHGFDTVDVDAATERGIMVTNAAYICNWEVANHAAAMILALNRQLVHYDRAMRDGVWDRAAGRPVGPLDGEVAGLVGFGAIGRSLAKRLEAFGLKVIAFDPYTDEWAFREYRVDRVTTLAELLSASDYVSIQVPLNSETRHMMAAAEYEAMKPSAYFVNCCRGGVVDESALYDALTSGQIRAAGLDVFETEPTPPDNPLLGLSNVIASPHAAGESTLSIEWSTRAASREAADMVRGQWPGRVVNPDVRRYLTREPAVQ